jgi:hypothetical protein
MFDRGGPQENTGKDMLAAHRGMNINEHEDLAVTDDIMAALEKNGIGETEKQEVLSIAYSLKSEILHVWAIIRFYRFSHSSPQWSVSATSRGAHPLGYKSVIIYSRGTGVTKPSGLSVNTEQST